MRNAPHPRRMPPPWAPATATVRARRPLALLLWRALPGRADAPQTRAHPTAAHRPATTHPRAVTDTDRHGRPDGRECADATTAAPRQRKAVQ